MTRSTQQLRDLVTPKKAIKPRNAKRADANSLRANGDEAYKEWLHDQPCAICGWRGKPEQMQEMHVKGGGVGRKADVDFTIPACGSHFVALGIRVFGRDWNQLVEGCHAASHRGQKTFEKAQGVNLLELAAEHRARYVASQPPRPEER